MFKNLFKSRIKVGDEVHIVGRDKYWHGLTLGTVGTVIGIEPRGIIVVEGESYFTIGRVEQRVSRSDLVKVYK